MRLWFSALTASSYDDNDEVGYGKVDGDNGNVDGEYAGRSQRIIITSRVWAHRQPKTHNQT